MKQRVVTLMWGTAWERYGKEFVETFRTHWPSEIDLLVVTDRRRKLRQGMGLHQSPPELKQIMLTNVPGYNQFMDRWGDDRRAQGYGCTDRKAHPEKRFWKNDAVKWAPQGIAPVAVIDSLAHGDILCWLDADVVTTKDVPLRWLDKLLNGHDIACIQRGTQHPEIGFWAIRCNNRTEQVVRNFNDIYVSGDVFDHKEWHSGYIFGKALQSVPGLTINNLNPTLMRGHPWPITPLAKYLIHKKGKLK